MRILQMTDLHGSERALKDSRMLIDEHSPDLFLVTGDITNFGPLEYARRLFHGLDVKTLGIPGNCDPEGIVPLMEELGISLHGKRLSYLGETLVGLGGSTPTPFGTPFELSEEEVERTLNPLMEAGVVLATHSPPYGQRDVVPGVGHSGSEAIRAIVERHQPKVHLCGHIHEGRGVEGGKTVCVNPGPAFRGHAAIVDIDDGVEVTLLP